MARSLQVFKDGSSSCTESVSSPAFSAINVGGQAYKAWAVTAKASHPFSDKGDSGAMVWATGPRGPSVVGLVTGGAGGCDPSSSSAHLTYVTPMEWILDDLKKNGFDVGVL
jgi:hypothetical protein